MNRTLEKLEDSNRDFISDQTMFWVECERYQTECTGARIEFIEDNNGVLVKHIILLFEELDKDD